MESPPPKPRRKNHCDYRLDRLSEAWQNGKLIPPYMLDADGVVLPEYREEVARLRIKYKKQNENPEAAAMLYHYATCRKQGEE